MAKVIAREYSDGVWRGIEFRAVLVDGLNRGVAEVTGEALEWFRARPFAFEVIEPERLVEKKPAK
jgi:hypothetical protein